MTNFDATSRDVCTIRRGRTNTPLQAMVLLNDVQFVEAARVLAEKSMANHGDDLQKRLQFMFHRLAGRTPHEQEINLLVEVYNEQKAHYETNPGDAKKLLAVGDSKTGATVNSVELAANTVVAQMILNSDSAIWKR